MWTLFATDVIIALIFLFVPGFLILKGVGLSSFKSIALAPLISVLILYLVAYCLLKAGIAGAWEVVIIPTFAASLLLFALGRVLSSRLSAKRGQPPMSTKSQKQQWQYLGAYIGFAALVGLMVFVKTLDGAASFSQQNDNFAHLAAVRRFLEAGFYANKNLISYPSAWYNIAALVASVGQQEVCVAINAVNYVVASFVFPAGICALMTSFFEKNKAIMLCGAICCVAFTEFPWGLLLFGPLYPNLLGFALLPSVMAIFISIFLTEGIRSKLRNGALFLLGCVALLFAHPNAIFSGIVLLVPFVCAWILKRTNSDGEPWIKKQYRVLITAGFLFLVFLIWTACYFAPAFSGTVQFTWPATLKPHNALANEFLLAFTQYSIPQLLLAILVLVGAIACFVKQRNRWMVISYAIALLILTTASSTEGFLKHFLAGFWYTDTYRIASMAAIAGIPLASMGLYYVVSALVNIAHTMRISKPEVKRFQIAIVLVATILIFMPNLKIEFGEVVTTPFGHVEGVLQRFNALQPAVYDESEIEFADQVKDVVGDSVVLNVPYDGSALSYGVNGLHVVNLDLYGYPDKAEGIKGTLVRSNLNNYADNQSIKDTLNNSDVRYVLLLDIDDLEAERTYPDHVDLSSWSGLMSITEDTPGFKLILSEGDMRLYELTDL